MKRQTTQDPAGAFEALAVKLATGEYDQECEDLVVLAHEHAAARVASGPSRRRVTAEVTLGTDHPRQRGDLVEAIARATGVESEYEGSGPLGRLGSVTLKGSPEAVAWVRGAYAALFKVATAESGVARPKGTTRQRHLTALLEAMTERVAPRLEKAARRAGIEVPEEVAEEVAA